MDAGKPWYEDIAVCKFSSLSGQPVIETLTIIDYSTLTILWPCMHESESNQVKTGLQAADHLCTYLLYTHNTCLVVSRYGNS